MYKVYVAEGVHTRGAFPGSPLVAPLSSRRADSPLRLPALPKAGVAEGLRTSRYPALGTIIYLLPYYIYIENGPVIRAV